MVPACCSNEAASTALSRSLSMTSAISLRSAPGSSSSSSRRIAAASGRAHRFLASGERAGELARDQLSSRSLALVMAGSSRSSASGVSAAQHRDLPFNRLSSNLSGFGLTASSSVVANARLRSAMAAVNRTGTLGSDALGVARGDCAGRPAPRGKSSSRKYSSASGATPRSWRFDLPVVGPSIARQMVLSTRSVLSARRGSTGAK